MKRAATSPVPSETATRKLTTLQHYERIHARFLACLARLSFRVRSIRFRATCLRSVDSYMFPYTHTPWSEAREIHAGKSESCLGKCKQRCKFADDDLEHLID